MNLPCGPEDQITPVGKPVEGGCIAMTASGLLFVTFQGFIHNRFHSRCEVSNDKSAIKIGESFDEREFAAIGRWGGADSSSRTSGDDVCFAGR